jgi:hypothetical protein
MSATASGIVSAVVGAALAAVAAFTLTSVVGGGDADPVSEPLVVYGSR